MRRNAPDGAGAGAGSEGLARLDELAGTWRVERLIEEPGGVLTRFEGRACLTPEPGGALAYAEAGTMTLPGGQSLRGERAYRFAPSADGKGVDVHFADGRFFHHFALGQARPAAHHHCAPDDYSVTYDFSALPDWSSRWRVTGPRKDYVMTTRYASASS